MFCAAHITYKGPNFHSRCFTLYEVINLGQNLDRPDLTINYMQLQLQHIT